MFKKFGLAVLLILCIALDCRASFWDALGQCFTNPCNCGFGDQIERWHGQDLNKGPLNPICPPWNKSGGRDGNNCLANTAYPTIFVPWHLVHCAENTPENTYFSPKIRIRNQTCNAVACWTMTKTLNWDGECLIWPTPYALPLLRICARVALPDNPKTKTPADPGYTYGKHLDFEGYEEDDETVIGADGQPVKFFKPKLCAYRDPSILDFISGGISLDGINIPDLMDFNPVKQPFHKTKELHIIGKILIFFIDMIAKTGQGLMNMLGSLYDKLGGAIIPNLNFFKPIFDVLGKIIEKFALAVKAIIEEFAQINRLVSDYKFGCVEIPLGPYPPPYCPKILAYVPSATTQFICETNSDGSVANSTASKPCVVSKVKNDPVSNAIRVTFDNLVPICKAGQDPTKTDKCVRFENVDLFNSAKTMHVLTARKDAIKPCSSTGGTDPCVRTIIPFSCSVSENGCEDGFRIVYAEKIGQRSMPSGYFIDNLEDCSSSNNHINCQEIWGINIGEFKDVSLTFPQIETANNISDLIQTFTLQDSNKMTRTFNATIVRKPRFDPSLQIQREPNQICVDENGEMIGCEDRAELTNTKVYDCDSGISGLPTCTSSYFVPKLVIAVKSNDNTHTTSAVVEPLSINNDTTSNYLVNLAGYDFSSFVTDETFVEKPFTGPKAFNSSTLFGTYKNDAVPFNSTTKTVNAEAIYLRGLEYMNDKYVQGGKYACAKFSDSDAKQCPIYEKNCVLSNLLNRDLVNCNDFFNKVKNYTGLRLCNATDLSCVTKDSIPGKSGGTGITIYQCGGATGNYCYKNASSLEVCKISLKPTDRYKPDPDQDPNVITPLSNSYYPSGLTQDFDSNLYALRDKVAIELGLCTTIPQPVCPAVGSPGTGDHNATWSEARVGEQSIGTCVAGASIINSAKPLKRYCISNAENQTINLEKLDDDVGCNFSSVNVTNIVSSFPVSYPQNISSNANSGSVVFGASGATNNVNNGIYYTNISVKIDNLSAVNSFKLTQASFQDYAIVTVNGHIAYSGPGGISNILSAQMFLPHTFGTSISNIDLKPFLVQGDNNIKIDLLVIIKGGLYYKIDYKLQ